MCGCQNGPHPVRQDPDDETTSLRARLAEVEKERDDLAAAKWDVQHTDTMNAMVQIGMARDEATARAERATVEIEAMRTRLDEVDRDRDAWINDALRQEKRAERAEAEVVRLTDKLAEEQRISTIRGNMIEFKLTPALHDAEAALATARRDALEDAARCAEGYNINPRLQDMFDAGWSRCAESIVKAIRALIAQEDAAQRGDGE